MTSRHWNPEQRLMIVILTWAVSGGSPEDEHGGQQRTLIIGNVTLRLRAATQRHRAREKLGKFSTEKL